MGSETNRNAFEEAGLMNPWERILVNLRSSENAKRTGLFSLIQLLSSDTTLSREEITFIHLAMIVGTEEAIELGATLLLRCQRPLQALLAALSEPDESCGGQSVAQEPLSG